MKPLVAHLLIFERPLILLITTYCEKKKTDHYGVRGISNKWFESYITDRKRFPFMTHKVLPSLVRLNLSHLNEYKFRHNFKEHVSSMCGFGLETELTQHFFLCSRFYHVMLKDQNSLKASTT